jgi:hypothetical protein
VWCDWDAPELKGDDSIYRPNCASTAACGTTCSGRCSGQG